MKKFFVGLTQVVALTFLCLTFAFGQNAPTGSIAGVVTDPAGAVVSGASVTIRNNDTGLQQSVTTSNSGSYIVSALGAGTYTVTVTNTGFKQVVVTEVKVLTNTPSTINVAMEVGAASEKVEVVGGGELLQTQTATVATTVTGRQITETPFTSRDALDLVMLLPGTQSPGPTRTSTVNGLPKASLNISMDGVNTQAQDSKSSFGGGFFTFVRPRIDAIEEVTVSTSNPGAEASSGGAIQISFTTKRGTNDVNGSLFWYHRNPALNANYYYRNRDLQPRPGEDKVRPDRILLNQFGGRVGGPIYIPGLYDGRDKSFFFVNYEEFRIPEQFFRQRTILSPLAQSGRFQYTGGPVGGVDLYAVAAGSDCDLVTPGVQPCTSTVDPTVNTLLNSIRTSTAQGSVTAPGAAGIDPNQQQFSFTATGSQIRKFTTVRFDHNITKNHSIENVWNYNIFDSTVDFLNSVDPIYPGLPLGSGSQISLRFSNVTALKSILSSNLVNQARFGLTGGTVQFFPEIINSQFTPTRNFVFGIPTGVAAGATGTFSSPFGANQNFRRNTPTQQFSNVLTWATGNHSLTFGANINKYSYWNDGQPTVVPTATFGIAANDPAVGFFNTTNFPGASAADLGRAQALYAILVGRITNASANAYLGEESGRYELQGKLVDRFYQREFGFYVQDAWRVRPNLTLNLGLRWDISPAGRTENNLFTRTTIEGLYGLSGVNGLFTPGATGGVSTTFTPILPGDKVYETDMNNFAPSFGIAWSPDFGNSFLGSMFGKSGATVIRGGYSIAYVREGTDFFRLHGTQNPGGTTPLTVSTAVGNLAPGSLFRNFTTANFPAFAATPTFPIVGSIANAPNAAAFNPNIKLGYVHSFSAGIQRELNKDTVVELRYVGNRSVDLWRTAQLNERNALENGLAAEVRLAQANLIANLNSGNGANFRFRGAGTGTVPLPILTAYLTGNTLVAGGGPLCNAANANNLACYQNGNFGPGTGLVGVASTTFTNLLSPANPNPIGFANQFVGVAGFRNNGVAAGRPVNDIVLNPQIGGALLVDNDPGVSSWFDSMVFEVRRRLSAGLLIQANYSFSKAISRFYGSTNQNNINYVTLRDTDRNKTLSPYDLRHGFKMNYIYELPFGRGRRFGGDSNWLVNGIFGGWETHGAVRWQSGSAINFGAVQLVGMDRKEFARSIRIIKDPNRITYFLPEDIRTNTIRAFSTGPTVSGYAGIAPTGRYLAPVGAGNCVQAVAGDCGFSNLVVHGPSLFRADLSVVKKIRFTERTNLEMRGEFLNAFNNINFWVGRAPTTEAGAIAPSSAATFGQTLQAFQDVSTTNDPGGRLVQLVLRLNF